MLETSARGERLSRAGTRYPKLVSDWAVLKAPSTYSDSDRLLAVDPAETVAWLVRFLQDEVGRQRGFMRAVVGLSGGVDSAVTAALCARAFGPENVTAFRLPYKVSSPESLAHARLVSEWLGVGERTIDITPLVDGYIGTAEPDASAHRIGNVCSRCRMVVLYDQSAKLEALPIGTSNKTERLFGYYTWHGDDTPAVNPLGDLFKTQVWAVGEELGVPEAVLRKPPTADLVAGQTDEGDLGLTYPEADRILVHLVRGVPAGTLVRWGFESAKVERAYGLVARTHWKRRLPTTAMLSDTAIGESYLRPVDDR